MGFADQDGDNPDANPLDRYGKHGCINPGGAVHYGNCSIVASCLNGIEPISLRNGNGCCGTATTVIDYGFHTRTILAQDNS